jgi:hypothetical protein
MFENGQTAATGPGILSCLVLEDEARRPPSSERQIAGMPPDAFSE